MKRPPTQRLKRTLCQDLCKRVIRVCEVSREERREWSEALVHNLSHMSNDDFIAFGHWGIGSMHEHVLECFLYGGGTLRSCLADEPCDRRVLQSGLLHVQLEVLEVFVGGLGEHSHVLFEIVIVLFPKRFRAL